MWGASVWCAVFCECRKAHIMLLLYAKEDETGTVRGAYDENGKLARKRLSVDG